MSISVNKFTATKNVFIFCLTILSLLVILPARVSSQTQDTGSIGIEGTIPSPAPTVGATISLPRSGQTFSQTPITVSGICPNGLLVKLFKNNVFSGSQQCDGGSFSMQVDLFIGTNDLIARVFDALDQPGPDSNKVTVSFNDNRPGSGPRVTLGSDYAKRGANPGQTLNWPIILSGGQGPYAISVDWGDGKAPDLKSVEFPGTFDIDHIYDNSGVYNIVVKATDKNGVSAFLQLVGVANGALSQTNDSSSSAADGSGSQNDINAPKTKIVWQPAAFSIPLIFSTFWLGKKYELKMLKRKIERGDRPF